MFLASDNWARVKEVFAAARALPADRRPAYLADACGDDDALRQEVESLLASDQRAKSFLEAPAFGRDDPARDQARLDDGRPAARCVSGAGPARRGRHG